MPKRVYRMDLPRTDFNATHMPTPEEIKQECEKIQKTWSSKERMLRTASAFRAVPASLAIEGNYLKGIRKNATRAGRAE